MVGQVIARSVKECGLPPGVFALLFGAGSEIGAALVDHPKVKAVGFTGSLSAGKALMQRAAARPEPIPCFMEMRRRSRHPGRRGTTACSPGCVADADRRPHELRRECAIEKGADYGPFRQAVVALAQQPNHTIA